ncbi:MAG TPA: outer membrane protein assembly factor BamE [Burkholderiales bacterium]|nr:outer membrane protein assembly factor BamE [Burkholderiales bacterium]
MRFTTVLLLPLVLAGCGWLSPHRIEIQQGNYVTQDLVSQLKPGMTRDQVRYLLGTPLVSDIFHADRWEYVFRRQRADSSKVEHGRLSVFFVDNKLERVDAEAVPPPPLAGAQTDSVQR